MASWLFRLDGALRLRLELAPSLATRAAAGVAAGVVVREVDRDQLPLGQSAAEIDVMSPWPWRCFVAFAGDAAVHHSFVQMRPDAPFLFRAVTIPAARGQGIFTAVVAAIATVLAAEGIAALDSSVGRHNRASLRAHRRAGFAIVGRRYDPIVCGIALRPLARDVRDWLAPVMRRRRRRPGSGAPPDPRGTPPRHAAR